MLAHLEVRIGSESKKYLAWLELYRKLNSEI